MSLFKNIFGDSEEQNSTSVNWIKLTSLSQLDEIIAQSGETPVLIFKHSTRCAVSRMSLKHFEKDFDLQAQMKTYFLDLIQYRDISNEIASRFNIRHESPQVLIISYGKCIYDVSHQDIDATTLVSVI